MDSFKRLFDEEDPVPENVLRNVEQRVQGSAQRVRFVGNTTDLYLGKVGATLAAFLGSGAAPKRHGRSAAFPTDNDAPPGGRN